ncbi:flagella basal body P-ring formation protein FlgA [Novosphingobium jiangmenense]|uniref:Flagella basal body P-ring formation protein FlgA n=1 Tax=Novosphingobium jiangmenense TaxID=2791981 RepID=A0ABS0HI99_9SPHN|nr:flagella basal body P-ring formation protein FlgA [Novosphingobium jiangmenense]MBF9151979.1 flagella basal body P-ring formation protein FlgA [Novosphingobium jiangmenense]
MTTTRFLAAALFATAPAAPASAQSSPFHDLVAIDRAVTAFTGAGIGEPGGATLPVDRRLRLAACRSPLSLDWQGSRQDTVLVQCPDAGGWRLFVATSGSARQMAAAPPAIARGEAVTISVAGDGFSVAQSGEAMESGAVGAWIRVRTSARATPLRARIERPGLVVVPVD